MSNLLNITATQFSVEVASSGKKYDFVGFHSASIEDPRAVHITRGSDGLDSEGIEYSEGNSSPVVVTCAVRTTQNFYPLFKQFWKKKERLNIYISDTNDGRIVYAKAAIIQKQPFQNTIEESEDSVNVSFIFESFQFDADYKGGESF
ncbi:MAG: hypothetical protein LBV16_09365 [Elusimicrobiota bacterium]|nr:hypothetical protein [Elusimicrobiota bacterium]